jgi:rhamnosyltransferase
VNDEKIAAIVVTYNPCPTHFDLALNSILQNVSLVIIVDNASSNFEVIENLPSIKSTKVFLVRNCENLGIAKAQNIGAEIAIHSEAVYLIFFDQDSQCAPYMVANLVSSWHALALLAENVGAIGPSHIDPRSNTKYPIECYNGPFLIKQNKPILGDLFRSDFLMASGLFTSVNNWQIIGKMNEDLFIDYVDHDWCFRAKAHNFSLFVLDRAELIHTVGDNRKKFFGRYISLHNPIRRYYLFRNGLLLLRYQHVPNGFKLRELFRNIFRFVFHFFHAKNKLSLLGFYHGIKKIDGPLTLEKSGWK